MHRLILRIVALGFFCTSLIRTNAGINDLQISNSSLVISVNRSNAAISVLDCRTQRLWTQQPTNHDFRLTGFRAKAREIEVALRHETSGLLLEARIKIERETPEFTISLDAKGAMNNQIYYPYPFATKSGDRLVVPMNEGISFPVDDKSIDPIRLVAYGGHGICMAFWGVTDGQDGHEAIIETPDDAAIRIARLDEELVVAPEWDSQKGQFGYQRRLRFVFFQSGGHVAIAKRYRQYVREKGRLKTLAEKLRENPHVDQLVGAVNIWNWDADPLEMVKQMRSVGIERILWSRGAPAEELRALNDMNVLTSTYDIYQDVMDPGNYPKLGETNADWLPDAWPGEIIRQADGSWRHGWGVDGKDGKRYDCGVLCDSCALPYARARIPADLAKNPYHCRFIDTTTASPWRECYDIRHPMTRTESRKWKMELLQYVSHDCHMVTGSETGHDAAVPYVDYFEGMLSLGPYRIPEAGRDMLRIWTNPPERVVKFQMGQAYRLPLWELVYHDCVVAQWYWGDYNNKMPSLWDKRDLFNVLYGTPPMFMFDKNIWAAEQARFAQSYSNTCPVVRAAGYAEMIDHRILTRDRNVQQTVFANGVTITVNFGSELFTLPTGEALPPNGFHVNGIPASPSR